MASKSNANSSSKDSGDRYNAPAPGSYGFESPMSGALTRLPKTAGLSRQRMVEARGDLMRTEHEYITLAQEAKAQMMRDASEMERRSSELRYETWSMEREAETRANVLKAQARMELKLAERIKEIADRSALSVLDRIKESSDSMMDWATNVGGDLTTMMRREASAQVERQVAEIHAIEEAMEEEARAVELLELTSRYRHDKAA